MEQVLTGLPLNTALMYLDDVLVAGKTFSDQLSHLRSVLRVVAQESRFEPGTREMFLVLEES